MVNLKTHRCTGVCVTVCVCVGIPDNSKLLEVPGGVRGVQHRGEQTGLWVADSPVLRASITSASAWT